MADKTELQKQIAAAKQQEAIALDNIEKLSQAYQDLDESDQHAQRQKIRNEEAKYKQAKLQGELAKDELNAIEQKEWEVQKKKEELADSYNNALFKSQDAKKRMDEHKAKYNTHLSNLSERRAAYEDYMDELVIDQYCWDDTDAGCIKMDLIIGGIFVILMIAAILFIIFGSGDMHDTLSPLLMLILAVLTFVGIRRVRNNKRYYVGI